MLIPMAYQSHAKKIFFSNLLKNPSIQRMCLPRSPREAPQKPICLLTKQNLKGSISKSNPDSRAETLMFDLRPKRGAINNKRARKRSFFLVG